MIDGHSSASKEPARSQTELAQNGPYASTSSFATEKTGRLRLLTICLRRERSEAGILSGVPDHSNRKELCNS